MRLFIHRWRMDSLINMLLDCVRHIVLHCISSVAIWASSAGTILIMERSWAESPWCFQGMSRGLVTTSSFFVTDTRRSFQLFCVHHYLFAVRVFLLLAWIHNIWDPWLIWVFVRLITWTWSVVISMALSSFSRTQLFARIMGTLAIQGILHVVISPWFTWDLWLFLRGRLSTMVARNEWREHMILDNACLIQSLILVEYKVRPG